MESKEVLSWQEAEALKRFQMISPLLDETLDADRAITLRNEIAEQNGISERSIRRYIASYRTGGFSGLKPQNRTRRRSMKLPGHYDEIVAEAIILKREEPRRSVKTIIRILELEGRIAPGTLRRSTLQRHLYKAGFGVRQMQMYMDARKSSSKRFCRDHRMELVQADYSDDLVIPIF